MREAEAKEQEGQERCRTKWTSFFKSSTGPSKCSLCDYLSVMKFQAWICRKVKWPLIFDICANVFDCL